MSFIAVGGTLLAGSTIGAGTIAAGAGLAGVGLNLLGQSQQNKANASTTASNQANIDKANQQDWNNYLLTRGINAGGTATTGSIPTNGTPVNTKLPLWASIGQTMSPTGAMSLTGGPQKRRATGFSNGHVTYS